MKKLTGPLLRKYVEQGIFSSRWVLVFYYYGLIVGQVIYCLKFIAMVAHLLLHFWTLDLEEVVLAVVPPAPHCDRCKVGPISTLMAEPMRNRWLPNLEHVLCILCHHYLLRKGDIWNRQFRPIVYNDRWHRWEFGENNPWQVELERDDNGIEICHHFYEKPKRRQKPIRL